ncbi:MULTISPECIES: hypothetical protein [unclassified Microbacterium]|uniref:hypothetical protein n=1 Tax=unclassified Microbacterium TaxID=2609290 RepID=UPI001ACE49C0|nr:MULTISPECIES: hypothetical protein [unclassified Microbacterium]MBN9157129.1 hypothetical protein [Microbacterium sp.]
MTNNPAMPLIPEDPEDPENADSPLVEDPDGDEKLDPDLNEDLIESAEADRIAAERDTQER